MTDSQKQQARRVIPLVGGPLDGAARPIRCSSETEAVMRPLLVFNEDSLDELPAGSAFSEGRKFVVFRLVESESGWIYTITRM